jgi:hypothetical protein
MAHSLSNTFPEGSKDFVVEGQPPNVFIKIDGLPQPDFRLFHTSGDARVAGEVESDQGTLGVQISIGSPLSSLAGTPPYARKLRIGR